MQCNVKGFNLDSCNPFSIGYPCYSGLLRTTLMRKNMCKLIGPLLASAVAIGMDVSAMCNGRSSK